MPGRAASSNESFLPRHRQRPCRGSGDTRQTADRSREARLLLRRRSDDVRKRERGDGRGGADVMHDDRTTLTACEQRGLVKPAQAVHGVCVWGEDPLTRL